MEIENFIETIYGVSTTHNQDFASYSETEGFHGFTESEMEAAEEFNIFQVFERLFFRPVPE